MNAVHTLTAICMLLEILSYKVRVISKHIQLLITSSDKHVFLQMLIYHHSKPPVQELQMESGLCVSYVASHTHEL